MKRRPSSSWSILPSFLPSIASKARFSSAASFLRANLSCSHGFGPSRAWFSLDFPKVLSFLNPTRAAAVAITRRPAPGKVVARTGKAEMPLCEGLSVRDVLGRRERQVQQYRIEVVNKFARTWPALQMMGAERGSKELADLAKNHSHTGTLGITRVSRQHCWTSPPPLSLSRACTRWEPGLNRLIVSIRLASVVGGLYCVK